MPTWRRAWRDKILPALVRFDPDLIFISAGFDAHRKDSINNRFIGIQEKDYEWITSQIVQVEEPPSTTAADLQICCFSTAPWGSAPCAAATCRSLALALQKP